MASVKPIRPIEIPPPRDLARLKLLRDAAFGLGSFAAAWFLRWLSEPWLENRSPYLLFTLSLLGCAVIVGRRAAMVVAILVLSFGILEASNDGSYSTADLFQLGLLALVFAGILVLADRVLRMRREDVCRRREAEDTLRSLESMRDELSQREQHLQSIIDTVPEAMIVIDEEGLVQSFSATAEAMFGFSESEILGENVSALMPSPDRERHNNYLKRYVETGERRVIGIGRVTTARRRDGVTFPVHLNVGETRIANQRLFTGFVEDLTERQETEHRLRDLQSELAHVARVSAMGTLATSLAHELNQPLTAIANYTSAARRILADPCEANLPLLRDALEECTTQSIHAGQIVRRLREFIAHGESEKRVESLNRLISEASALALVGAGNLGIDFNVSIAAECDLVVVDRIQVQQVLLNLIRNAVEAMYESPERRIQITARRCEGEFAEVVIADSGPGLPDEVRSELFRPFVSTKVDGLGVGLSICHTIIGGHGGHIWTTESELGGTAFHLTLMRGIAGDE